MSIEKFVQRELGTVPEPAVDVDRDQPFYQHDRYDHYWASRTAAQAAVRAAQIADISEDRSGANDPLAEYSETPYVSIGNHLLSVVEITSQQGRSFYIAHELLVSINGEPKVYAGLNDINQDRVINYPGALFNPEDYNPSVDDPEVEAAVIKLNLAMQALRPFQNRL